jgi:hypothetical protein
MGDARKDAALPIEDEAAAKNSNAVRGGKRCRQISVTTEKKYKEKSGLRWRLTWRFSWFIFFSTRRFLRSASLLIRSATDPCLLGSLPSTVHSIAMSKQRICYFYDGTFGWAEFAFHLFLVDTVR